MAIDIHYSSISLLIHANGSSGGTTFVDSSGDANTLTVVGSVNTNTTDPHFGVSSAYFDGTGDAITLPLGTTSLDFGSGNFTLDAWVKPSVAVANQYIMVGRGDGATIAGSSFTWNISSTTVNSDLYVGGTAYSVAAPNPTVGVWSHIALVRNGSTLSTYLNGTLVGSASCSGAINAGTTNPPSVGGLPSGGVGFTGYIDELCVTKGIARFTSNFTPPAFEYSDVAANMNLLAPAAVVLGFGGGGAALTSPSPLFYAGVMGSATLNAVAPSALLSTAGGGYTTLSAPSPQAYATGHDSTGEWSAVLLAPTATLSSYGGATSATSAPSSLLSATATGTSAGTALLTAPAAKIVGQATVAALSSFAATAPRPTITSYAGAVCSVTLNGKTAVSATGTTGSVGFTTIAAPLFDLTASGTEQNHGSAIIAAPSARLATTGAAWLIAPGAQLTAIGTAVVAVTYEAYALNLKHNPAPGQEPVDEMTRYTNYPFDRIVRYKNSYFGMNSTGLYLLEGTTDFAEPTPTPVAWSWRTSLTDFKSAQLKNVSMVYFGGRMPPASTVTAYVGEAGTNSYSFTTPRGAAAQNYRQPLGKGMKSRYYAVGAAGAGDMTLDTLTFNVSALTRKV